MAKKNSKLSVILSEESYHKLYLNALMKKCHISDLVEEYASSLNDYTVVTKNKTSKKIVSKPTKPKGEIYFIKNDSDGLIKIGYSNCTENRIKAIQTGSSSSLTLLGILNGTQTDEKKLHVKFAKHRISGEWFTPVKELTDYIKKNAVEELYNV